MSRTRLVTRLPLVRYHLSVSQLVNVVNNLYPPQVVELIMKWVEQIRTHQHQASLQSSLQQFSGSTSSLQPPKGFELGAVREAKLHKWYLPGPNMIWNEAEVMENLSTIQLVHRQQTTLEAGTCLDLFGLKKCT